MANEITKTPEVGQLVRKSGGEILYRVVESRATGCRVEATVTEAVPSQTYGTRQARPLHYSEKRASLALCTAPDGRKVLIDDRWNAWEVVQ